MLSRRKYFFSQIYFSLSESLFFFSICAPPPEGGSGFGSTAGQGHLGGALSRKAKSASLAGAAATSTTPGNGKAVRTPSKSLGTKKKVGGAATEACAWCGIRDVQLKRCLGCKSVSYCSRSVRV